MQQYGPGVEGGLDRLDRRGIITDTFMKIPLSSKARKIRSVLALFLRRMIFGLLIIGHYLTNLVISTNRSLSNSKKRALALFIVFLVFLSFFEIKTWKAHPDFDNLLVQAINRQDKSLENQNIPLAREKNKQKTYQIASLEREEISPSSLTPEGILVTNETDLDPSKPLTRTETETYYVQSGDTLYSIADKFGLSIDTLLWGNNLTLRSIIRPGQALEILPVDGITHKVKKGETLQGIAKKYKSTVEYIIDFNNLADASDIFEGDELIIPYGQKPYVPLPPSVKPKIKKYYAYTRPTGENCHSFEVGQCTWYVATRRCIPWSGNANQWIGRARNMGFQIGYTPQVGAVISLRESRRYGHVGYVEYFNDETVTFSEMNVKGLGIKTKRTLNLDDSRILGYIY